MPESTDEAQRTYRSLSELLSTLHQVRHDAQSIIPGVASTEFSCDDLLEELVAQGEIGGSQAVWLDGWFRHLEAAGARTSESVLLHGDVMPSNLILDESGTVTAILDWGSARWGEPARDLAGFRSSRLPAVVDAYRTAADTGRAGSGDGSNVALAAGVLWYQLFFALAKVLGRQSTSEERNWSAPREARLLELMRFVAAGVPDRWSSLLRWQ